VRKNKYFESSVMSTPHKILNINDYHKIKKCEGERITDIFLIIKKKRDRYFGCSNENIYRRRI